MAVRFDASGDYYLRTTSLPPIAAVTIAGWFKISVDQNVESSLIAFGHASSSDAYLCSVGADGVTLQTWNGAANVTGTTLTVGTWQHIAMVVDGTGAGNFRIYLNGALDITAAGRTQNTAGALYIANNSFAESWNGCTCAIKIWGAALTLAEIAQEVRTIRPQRSADLNAWYPCFPGATERLADYSGNGRNWTAGGTLADEDPPPVSWGRLPIFFPFVAASGASTADLSAGGATTAATGSSQAQATAGASVGAATTAATGRSTTLATADASSGAASAQATGRAAARSSADAATGLATTASVGSGLARSAATASAGGATGQATGSGLARSTADSAIGTVTAQAIGSGLAPRRPIRRSGARPRPAWDRASRDRPPMPQSGRRHVRPADRA